MANISDVYDIQFEASSKELADALEAYLKAIDSPDNYYDIGANPVRVGNSMTTDGASGRWTYATNLEGAFENPKQWFGENFTKVKAEYKTMIKLLKAGHTIDVRYAEDEAGQDIFQDAWGEIAWYATAKSAVVNLDFEDHDRPDCSIEMVEGKPYCYDHDEELEEMARYCEMAL